MFVFKILLIILIALPVVALASYFYAQMLKFIKTRNDIEDEAIRQSVAESGAENRKRAGRRKSNKKSRQKSETKEKSR